jgi:hypothetical protein
VIKKCAEPQLKLPYPVLGNTGGLAGTVIHYVSTTALPHISLNILHILNTVILQTVVGSSVSIFLQ